MKLTPEQRVQQAYNAAVRLLGSRDHSVFELKRKLVKREHDDEAIQAALDELIELNYVNDRRYAGLYTEQRLERGYGPLSVRSKLRERGIDSHLIEAALAEQTVSWVELAQLCLQKKFGPDLITSRDARDESRISRFLATRGFSGHDALKALQAARKDIQTSEHIYRR